MFSSPPEDSLTWNSTGLRDPTGFKLGVFAENKNAILSNFESVNANELDPKLLEAEDLFIKSCSKQLTTTRESILIQWSQLV